MNGATVALDIESRRRRDVGQHVRAARLAAGLSLARTVEAMRQVGFPNWYINTLVTVETGSRRLRTLEIAALCEVLDCVNPLEVKRDA